MLDRFARLLGIRIDQAEDALHSERGAKHVVSRRDFFGAAGALTAGTVFSFAAPEPLAIAAPVIDHLKGPIPVPDFRRFAGVTGIYMPMVVPSGYYSRLQTVWTAPKTGGF